jgi:hypothetical protein
MGKYILELYVGEGGIEMDKEELIGNLFVTYISPTIEAGEAKRHAVERYMRTYLRSLTNVELEFELKFAETNGFVSPTIQFKIDQASKGYDRFMERRGKQ